MKQFKFLALAAGTLLLASCANEDIAEPKGDGTVSFTLEMPGDLDTRVFGDGTKAKDLYFAVYEHESTTPIIVSEAEYQFVGLKTTVNLKLVNGKNYDIIWWAQSPEVNCYTFKPEDQTVEISYTGIASNDENRDAFFQHTTTGVINAAFSQTVKLYRPFAQLNFGTDDLDEPAVSAAFPPLLSIPRPAKQPPLSALRLLPPPIPNSISSPRKPQAKLRLRYSVPMYLAWQRRSPLQDMIT